MSSAEKADEFFCAKVRGMVTAVETHCYPKFSSFLDGRQRRLAEEVLRQMHCTRYVYEGGSAYAERKMLGVYPDYMEADALVWPMQVLRFVFHKNYVLSHRDVLGSLMALQIKRELLGDIYVAEGLAEIVVQESIAEFIRTNVQKIGRVGVQVETADALTLAAEPKLKALTGTVASFRLDSVLSLATGLSRTKAMELIPAGKVTVNYLLADSPSLLLKPQDVISVRGYGKYLLGEEIHMTKKNRYFITIYQYL